jgi:hypothetical protein
MPVAVPWPPSKPISINPPVIGDDPKNGTMIRAEHQQDDSANDGTRQEQPLHPADLDANNLPDQQPHAEDQQGETDGLGVHVITSQFVEYRSPWPACPSEAGRSVRDETP